MLPNEVQKECTKRASKKTKQEGSFDVHMKKRVH